ncbi:hypothetical protein [Pontibacter liquoris]|uniref:hypothetical protein n=1 Tax=Pontibacter liquoris TaxID=2905677 RepID=UPI001FA735F1|nr:hypothetical protein [Pontibacter liquoris]
MNPLTILAAPLINTDLLETLAGAGSVPQPAEKRLLPALAYPAEAITHGSDGTEEEALLRKHINKSCTKSFIRPLVTTYTEQHRVKAATVGASSLFLKRDAQATAGAPFIFNDLQVAALRMKGKQHQNSTAAILRDWLFRERADCTAHSENIQIKPYVTLVLSQCPELLKSEDSCLNATTLTHKPISYAKKVHQGAKFF